MALDVTVDQLGPLRRTAALASPRTPLDGLYISGAGTAPTGVIAGSPARVAARAVLARPTPPPNVAALKAAARMTKPAGPRR